LKECKKESIEVEEKMIEVDDGVGKAFQYNFASKRKRSKLMDGSDAIREFTCSSAEGR
jgi:hypothetical protein